MELQDKDCVPVTEVFDMIFLSQSNLMVDQDGVWVNVEPVVTSPGVDVAVKVLVLMLCMGLAWLSL